MQKCKSAFIEIKELKTTQIMKKLLLAFALCAMTAVAGAQTQKVSVLEYCPAPGQFVNVLPEVEEGMTREQV